MKLLHRSYRKIVKTLLKIFKDIFVNLTWIFVIDILWYQSKGYKKRESLKCRPFYCNSSPAVQKYLRYTVKYFVRYFALIWYSPDSTGILRQRYNIGFDMKILHRSHKKVFNTLLIIFIGVCREIYIVGVVFGGLEKISKLTRRL